MGLVQRCAIFAAIRFSFVFPSCCTSLIGTGAGLRELTFTPIFYLIRYGLDIARFRKRLLGEDGADQFIDQDSKQGDIANQVTLGAELPRGDAHTKRDTGLREQGDPRYLHTGGAQ